MRMDWDLDNVSLMGLPRWFLPLTVQVEVEDRAFARLGFEPDATVVTLDDFLHKGESDARAGLLPVGRVVEPLENTEDLLVELGFDANAVVLDVKDIPLWAFRRVDHFPKSDLHDTPCLVVVFDGIGYEIAE